MTTIRDVALAAQVSVATVSRVVNGDPAVHPLLRRQVEDTVRSLGYSPNAAARSLRRARSGSVGVVVSELDNPALLAIVDGMARVAAERGTSLIFCDTRNSYQAQAAHLQQLHAQRVEGVVLQPIGPYAEQIAPLRSAGIPVVITGNRSVIGDLPQVVVREHAASVAAFRHLIKLGHRRIAFVLRARQVDALATPTGILADRVGAYHAAHREAGIPVDPALILSSPSSEESGRLTAALLARPDRPTAFVCGIHTDAANMLLAVKRSRLRIPDQVSFLTYGDSAWMEAHEPAVSVIRRDFSAYGRLAAGLLFALADHAACDTVISQDCELVLRESSAPPAGCRP